MSLKINLHSGFNLKCVSMVHMCRFRLKDFVALTPLDVILDVLDSD